MRLDGEFTVKVNKVGKRTCEYIRAIHIEKTLSEISITDICGKIRKFDRTVYEYTRM